MRNCHRNQRVIKALNCLEPEPYYDEDGNETGELKIKYSPVIVFKASVSGARGSSQSEIFGTDITYDKTLSVEKGVFERHKFDENTVFFIDVKAKFQDGTPLYDYRVKRIAETQNQVVIAVVSVKSNE